RRGPERGRRPLGLGLARVARAVPALGRGDAAAEDDGPLRARGAFRVLRRPRAEAAATTRLKETSPAEPGPGVGHGDESVTFCPQDMADRPRKPAVLHRAALATSRCRTPGRGSRRRVRPLHGWKAARRARAARTR